LVFKREPKLRICHSVVMDTFTRQFFFSGVRFRENNFLFVRLNLLGGK